MSADGPTLHVVPAQEAREVARYAVGGWALVDAVAAVGLLDAHHLSVAVVNAATVLAATLLAVRSLIRWHRWGSR